jgi:Family of unknown function (DUF5317)
MLLFAICVGLIAGLARGGRPAALNVKRSAFLLIWLALALQVLVGRLPGPADTRSVGFYLTVTSYAVIGIALCVVAFSILRTLDSRASSLALALMCCGWLLNTTVITANHGMPISRSAIAEARGDPNMDVSSLGVMYKHVPLTSQTVLGGLGDVIAVPISEAVPPLPRFGSAVVSPGDLVLLSGITLALFGWLRPRTAHAG